ncbi:Esterase, SGNH hydrolase-type [Cordyceps fumosorosea ARSEF 2679]|uniref:Esterase, SGNH hydrolase-type n=1 Tax=Cordyceps fumosorosea (strain ARSEF 2679) TaxID=1081104 RepID=A0A162JU35_CORFA|nr:Esterase, SGNH hydrolase-type [Cordyceps fumosorosea ARSEF 2679]OAA73822.1 Esterase, SGNH hydrolase-type [Cordyceps fumosorosea ARSEF 2679]
MPPRQKSLRILCFGDSLTQGFFSFGMGEHPYSSRLAERLRAALPEGMNVEIRTSVTARPYDWVITLGGTNDIAMGCHVDDTFKSLRNIWQLALSRRCNILAMTVPETHGDFAMIERKRADLNGRILSYEAENYYAFDLHAKIPYKALNYNQRQAYWDDGVHLTEEGYDWMGDHVADALIPLIIGTDATKFEEEEEVPKNISRGYVVVRKQDLD